MRSLESLATWGRLKFKPKKSRSLIVKKGVVTSRTFEMQAERIPSVKEEPIRCLGKWFDKTLRDRDHTIATEDQLKEWLERIDQTSLPGKLKAWCFQHGIIPRLGWPFSMYEFPLTAVERMERSVSKFVHKWLEVPKSFCSVNLYSTSFPASMPIMSLESLKRSLVRTFVALYSS